LPEAGFCYVGQVVKIFDYFNDWVRLVILLMKAIDNKGLIASDSKS